MKSKKEIKNKLVAILAKKNEAFRNGDDLSYKAYCKSENILKWILEGDLPLNKEQNIQRFTRMARKNSGRFRDLAEWRYKRVFSTYFKAEEKQVLFRKYLSKGYSTLDAGRMVDFFINRLKEIEIKIRKEAKNEREANKLINERFKNSFERLFKKI